MSEIELKFDQRFIPRLLNGLKVRTWRRTAHGKTGDAFTIDYYGETCKFEIVCVEPISQGEFIEQYWFSDGFSSEAEARDYFDRHYFTPGGWSVDLHEITGFMHGFRRVRNEDGGRSAGCKDE